MAIKKGSQRADKKCTPLVDSAERRRSAEMLLGARSGSKPRSRDVADRILHELELHQIELEMQNSELNKARDDMGAMLEKYTDLFEFAPVSYFTLDREGTICSVNLTGASLLGTERSRLNGRRFEHFVEASDRSAFATFLENVFASRWCSTGRPPAAAAATWCRRSRAAPPRR